MGLMIMGAAHAIRYALGSKEAATQSELKIPPNAVSAPNRNIGVVQALCPRRKSLVALERETAVAA